MSSNSYLLLIRFQNIIKKCIINFGSNIKWSATHIYCHENKAIDVLTMNWNCWSKLHWIYLILFYIQVVYLIELSCILDKPYCSMISKIIFKRKIDGLILYGCSMMWTITQLWKRCECYARTSVCFTTLNLMSILIKFSFKKLFKMNFIEKIGNKLSTLVLKMPMS